MLYKRLKNKNHFNENQELDRGASYDYHPLTLS